MMKFTPAHIKVVHGGECALHVNRKALRKLEHVLAYLKDQRMSVASEWNAGLKDAILMVIDHQIAFGECTDARCYYVRVAGQVVLA